MMQEQQETESSNHHVHGFNKALLPELGRDDDGVGARRLPGPTLNDVREGEVYKRNYR